MENKFGYDDCGCSFDGKEIKGIVCDVKHCIHHNTENGCTAGQVAIGPADAFSSKDTVCATFRPRDGFNDYDAKN